VPTSDLTAVARKVPAGARPGNSREFLSACTPGYYNNEGDTSAGGLLDQVYTPGINQFNAMLAEWRARGDLEGLRLYK